MTRLSSSMRRRSGHGKAERHFQLRVSAGWGWRLGVEAMKVVHPGRAGVGQLRMVLRQPYDVATTIGGREAQRPLRDPSGRGQMRPQHDCSRGLTAQIGGPSRSSWRRNHSVVKGASGGHRRILSDDRNRQRSRHFLTMPAKSLEECRRDG